MKTKYLILFLLITVFHAKAQVNLPEIAIAEHVNIHIISPEPIQYVDISSKDIIGDLPLRNVLRLKLKDSIKNTDAVITIVGERFIAQYHLVGNTGPIPTEINIVPEETKSLDISGIGLTQNELKAISLNILSFTTGVNVAHANAFGISGSIRNIYTAGDYVFIDLQYVNKTNLRYDIDGFKFKLDDKKIVKATNAQSVELKPVFQLMDNSSFEKNYRNIFVFKKISYPGDKLLNIELNEKQISGRVITIGIPYKAVLKADIVPAK